MPMLTASQVHLDQPLTNLTLAYLQSRDNFVADRVFPMVEVDKQSDKYYIYNREDFNRVGDRKVLAPKAEIEETEFALSNDNYFAEVYGHATSFDERVLANEDAALDVRRAGSEMLINKMMLERELDWASTYFSTGVWGTEWDGNDNGSASGTDVVHWDDYTNSTPIVDIRNLKRTVQLKSGGFIPNTMVVSKEVRDKLLDNPDILARLNTGVTPTDPALVTDAMLAQIFDVSRFMSMEAVQNTAAEGATESNSFIGGNNVLLCYTPASAGLMTPAAGLNFVWNSVPGASFGVTVESFTGDWLRVKGVAEKIQVKQAYDMKVVGSDLGGFLNGILS